MLMRSHTGYLGDIELLVTEYLRLPSEDADRKSLTLRTTAKTKLLARLKASLRRQVREADANNVNATSIAYV